MNENNIKIHKWLYPISWFYGIVTAIRNKLFDWKLFQSKSYPIPIICIGNLAVGGTGKTPHTEHLIKILKNNFQIAVLSRGYKRKSKGYILATTDSSVEDIGDEPYQMHNKFPNITVAVDEDRCHGIEKLSALTAPRIDAILLDDAFQHRYVKPGLNILLTDFHRLFCDDKLLPAGRLREDIEGKNRAHIIIVTKCPTDIKPIDYNIIAKRLNLYPYQQLFFSTLQYGKLFPMFPEEQIEDKDKQLKTIHNTLFLDELKEYHVLLVTGIASPEPLIQKLKKISRKIEIVNFADHHSFSTSNLQNIEERFQKIKEYQRIIITTEKDATKLIHHPGMPQSIKPFLYVLPIEIEILQNQQDKFNQHIINYVRENTRNCNLS